MINILSAVPQTLPLPAVNKVDVSLVQPSALVPSESNNVVARVQSLPGMADSISQPLRWENKSRDALTVLISGHYASQSLAGRFDGLGAALLDQFKGDVRGMSQSVRQAPPGAQLNSYGGMIAPSQASLHGHGENQVSFDVTTKSGVHVQILLDSQADGLGVQMTIDGKLNETERMALAGLSSAFEDAVGGIAGVPPQLKLAGLTQFDPAVLASVELHTEVRQGGAAGVVQILDFHADASQRKVSFNGLGGKVDVGVDMSKPASLGSKAEQAKALAAYLKQFDEAALHGRADAAQMTLFKDAFAAMNSDYGVKAPPPIVQFHAAKTMPGEQDQSLLSGLADFSASVEQTAQAINPMHLDEIDTFSYQLSQSTRIGGHGSSDRSIMQQRQSRLKASYHLPANGGALNLSQDPATQSYDYYQIDESSSSTAQVAYRDGMRIKATIDQSVDKSTRVMSYVLGQLTSDITTPQHQSQHINLLEEMTPVADGFIGLGTGHAAHAT